MRKSLSMFLIVLLFFVAGLKASDETSFQMPKIALKLFGDSLMEGCKICVKDLRKKASKILNEEFPAGKVVTGDENSKFIKLKTVEENTFGLDCCKDREFYKEDESGEKVYFPSVVFKFHTKKIHLAGVKEADYTDNTIESKFLKLQGGSRFRAKIVLIKYEYGDGDTYNYFEKDNILQFHCKILEIK